MSTLTSAMGFGQNVEWRLFDSSGRSKPIFQENWLAIYLLSEGLLSPLWINRWYAPLVMPLLGHWADKKVIHNKIVNAGLALVAGLMNGSGTPTTPTFIAVGTGTTAVAATDTALVTETATSGLSRAAATVSLVTTTATNDTAQWVKSFSVTGSVAVTESGVFNASSVGTMLCRQTFSAVNVVNGDTFQVTWKIQATSQN